MKISVRHVTLRCDHHIALQNFSLAFMPEPPAKRQKSSGRIPRKFATADEIRQALSSHDQAELAHTLSDLRTQFALWSHGNSSSISSSDPRLLLVSKYLEASPGAHDLFSLWESYSPNIRNPGPLVLLVSLFASILSLLSTHYTFHAPGHTIVRTLLTPAWMRRLNSYVGGTHNELVLVTLKLFNVLSVFGGGREKRAVLEGFAWETKSLPKLLSMRRRSSFEDSADALTKPDIRTLYVLFCLSFVDHDTLYPLKTAFLEQHKDVFYSIFRGLHQDSFVVIRRVLEICWAGIWSDPKLKRTLKITLFNEITISHLLKIHERQSAEDDDPEHVPADLVHHFLLAICTHPGRGLVFKDQGWYPRTIGADDKGNSRLYNKILANILKTLKVNEDSRHQELALKMMAACPELVAGFWSAANLTLEPRLSSRWIANISFFGHVISLPVPTASFSSVDQTVLYQPSPPPLNIILENVFPSVNTKTHFSKGLQHSSGLVQHCTALALCKCLGKYRAVLDDFRIIQNALKEDVSDGQWSKMQRDLEKEIRHRVPEFQVVLAYATGKTDNDAKAALLAESAQRLLWMYHSCLPSLVSETRFDVGKMVQNLSSQTQSSASAEGLNPVRRLHVIRLLRDSPQFVWSGKSTATGRSHLHVLLGLFCDSGTGISIKKAVGSLIVHLLASSVAFQHNVHEADLWLRAADGATDSVATFLDQCLQVHLKKPYQYMEDLRALAPDAEPVSSLLLTVLEQLTSRTEPALFVFVRRLFIGLSSIQRDLTLLRLCFARLESLTVGSEPEISRQVDIVRWCLDGFPETNCVLDSEPMPDFEDVNQLLTWMKIVGTHSREDLQKGFQLVVQSDASAVAQFADAVDPRTRLLWTLPLADIQSHQVLVNAALRCDLLDLKRMVCLVGHKISSNTSPTLMFLASVCRGLASSPYWPDVRLEIFTHSSMCEIFTRIDAPKSTLDGISALLAASLDAALEADRQVVSELTQHWLGVLTESGFHPASRSLHGNRFEMLTWLMYPANQSSSQLVDAAVKALEHSTRGESLLVHLPVLASLAQNSPALESMIAAAVGSCLPIGIQGYSLNTQSLDQCAPTWARRAYPLTAIPKIESLLFQDSDWTDSSVTLAATILYRSGCDPDRFSQWLSSDFASRRSTAHLARVFQAQLERSPHTIDASAFDPFLGRLFAQVADDNVSSTLREPCAAACHAIFNEYPEMTPKFLSTLEKCIGKLRDTSLTMQLLSIGKRFSSNSLIEHALRWGVDVLATSEPDTLLVGAITSMIEATRSLHSASTETLLSVIIQHRLFDDASLALSAAILRKGSFKPLLVNRYIQSIIQHPHFFRACNAPSRDALIAVLHVLFNWHPANTCQPTHIQPLVPIYRGTASASDRKLLSILRLFEDERKVSIAAFLSQWSPSVDVPSTGALEAVQSLDPVVVLRTCVHFPDWRKLAAGEAGVRESSSHAQIYDPVFLILLFAHAMAEDVPESAFAWIQIFRTNVVSLVIRGLSSKDADLRHVAWAQLAALWAHLESADMQEQPQVVYVLNVLRNAISESEPAKRLPSYATLTIAHALRGIFYPAHFTYPLTARFLLQRPSIDLTDVPLLYGMLYSSSDDWKKERGWIIRFIADGMSSSDDWRVLKRRHTWELLATLFQSSEEDQSLRNAILEVLANVTCNRQATTSLLLKSNLLQWIETQLLQGIAEVLAWTRILENILVVVDAAKLESATAGEWRSVVSRCLAILLKNMPNHGGVSTLSPNFSLTDREAKPDTVLATIAPVILRLSSLPGNPPHSLREVLDLAVQGIQSLERDIPLHGGCLNTLLNAESAPCRAEDLHRVPEMDCLTAWGFSLECLWQASMCLPQKSTAWDELTPRLLVWRSMVGLERCVVGEWARKMTVSMV
ncbi:unnamed protein product [Mycena citricolor]|uniref:Nucleolar pre-ribosomal-associated protein 1 C-terminal domain-containing protein n=1 Tax=Mycena citricolor TaxID=2018698 RepID=A0AAD2HWJ8_9AGAR|nr:unnamed protein product [Mycena citricolor]